MVTPPLDLDALEALAQQAKSWPKENYYYFAAGTISMLIARVRALEQENARLRYAPCQCEIYESCAQCRKEDAKHD